MSMPKLETTHSATLTIDGQSIELPIVQGTENEKSLDISKLRSETGYTTLDPAFVNTASCTSKITYLDGENGILQYRGYSVEEIAERASFLETSYLLIHGTFPTKEESKAFQQEIAEHSKSHPLVFDMLKSFPKDAHPMGVLSSLVVSLSALYPQYSEADLKEEERKQLMQQLIAQFKNLVCYIYRSSQGLPFVDSDANRSFGNDFLNMMFSGQNFEFDDPDIEKALNTLLILHADHEQNCSTSTVRIVGSSKANLYATIASGINALWGPLHGGANQAVIEMLEKIKNSGGNYKEFLDKAKDKNDPFKLMGFGHRVYKNFDPRAKIIKASCDTVLNKLGISDPLLDIAKGLEEEALKDEYFVQRKLYPNVDFYSGVIYKALNIPTNMFTAMFALGRLPGWLAQWNEMISDQSTKISRPRQIYLGETSRKMK